MRARVGANISLGRAGDVSMRYNLTTFSIPTKLTRSKLTARVNDPRVNCRHFNLEY